MSTAFDTPFCLLYVGACLLGRIRLKHVYIYLFAPNQQLMMQRMIKSTSYIHNLITNNAHPHHYQSRTPSWHSTPHRCTRIAGHSLQSRTTSAAASATRSPATVRRSLPSRTRQLAGPTTRIARHAHPSAAAHGSHGPAGSTKQKPMTLVNTHNRVQTRVSSRLPQWRSKKPPAQSPRGLQPSRQRLRVRRRPPHVLWPWQLRQPHEPPPPAHCWNFISALQSLNRSKKIAILVTPHKQHWSVALEGNAMHLSSKLCRLHACLCICDCVFRFFVSKARLSLHRKLSLKAAGQGQCVENLATCRPSTHVQHIELHLRPSGRGRGALRGVCRTSCGR